MTGEAYLASDDSALLREALRSYSGGSCLEIGAGNGGNLIVLSSRFGVALGTDLVRPRMRDWEDGRTDYVLADGASCLRDSCFDLVAFNPPYLRTEGIADRTVEGGPGLEVPMNFLREALRVVRPSGRVVLLLNDDADEEDFKQECLRMGFGFRRVASRRVFFEELSVFEASGPEVPRSQFER